MRASFFLFIVLILCASSGSFAQSKVGFEQQGAFGVKGGWIGSTEVKVYSPGTDNQVGELKTSSSYALGVFVEQRIVSKLRGLISVDILNIQEGRFGADGSENFLLFSAGAKYRYRPGNANYGFSPVVSIGYGWMPKISGLHNSDYRMLGTGIEFSLHAHRGNAFLIEILRLTSLSGSDGEYDVSAGPMMLYRIGVIF